VTVRGLYEVAPFDNTIIVVELTGEQLVALLDNAGGDRRTLLEGSNLKLRYKIGAVAGERVVSLKIGGVAVDPAKTYRVATNSFLAAGGDGHALFKSGRQSTDGKLLRDALIDHLESGGKCSADKTPRIADK
jgi:5'-nucleotidase